MAARRLQISLRVLKNISRGSALFIIIINTNEIPHHFTFYIYIFFFGSKSCSYTQSTIPNPNVCLNFDCVSLKTLNH